jgi:hypothetical protein
MAYFEEGSEAMLQLEAMVDRVGIRNVLYALAKICDGKAEATASMWQDETLAQMWNRWASRIESLAEGSTLNRWRNCIDPLARD